MDRLLIALNIQVVTQKSRQSARLGGQGLIMKGGSMTFKKAVIKWASSIAGFLGCYLIFGDIGILFGLAWIGIVILFM